ncbi:unnamed protein product [Adineta steineri]|uniref:EF-hand domain-containing protein n=1 Tax=Adineta steineri TaxID=433720 RepID=A0A814BKI3_9BILA|nr:unnamed protein product [Adineta steineri]CAF3908995.1 unnamed protein product [Adineta steineri]
MLTDLLNFGREHLENGTLFSMLETVGINNADDFINGFRNQTSQEAERIRQSSHFMSLGESVFGLFSGNKDENDSLAMIQAGYNTYKLFSDGQQDEQSDKGGFLGEIGSTISNAKKMYDLYKSFDKNGDGKITTEDIQTYFQEMGLGFVSLYLTKGLFLLVDKNQNGCLDFVDLMGLCAIVYKLSQAFGGGAGNFL